MLTGWVRWEWPGWHPLQPSGRWFSCYRWLSMVGNRRRRGAYLGFFPLFAFASFPPFPFFPILVPFATSSIVSGCASPSGSSWCFFWCLLAWLPAFEGPCLQTGVWVRTWPLCNALSSPHVRGGMVSAWWIVVVWLMVVVVRRKWCGNVWPTVTMFGM